MIVFDAIELWCSTLLALGYDLDRLVVIEGELRYIAGLVRGAWVRGGK